MFIKYSISKIDHVFKDYTDFTKFVKSAGLSDKKYQNRIFKKVLDEVFKEGADLGYKATVGLELGESGFVDTKTSLIMTLFRAWMQAENAGGVISR